MPFTPLGLVDVGEKELDRIDDGLRLPEGGPNVPLLVLCFRLSPSFSLCSSFIQGLLLLPPSLQCTPLSDPRSASSRSSSCPRGLRVALDDSAARSCRPGPPASSSQNEILRGVITGVPSSRTAALPSPLTNLSGLWMAPVDVCPCSFSSSSGTAVNELRQDAGGVNYQEIFAHGLGRDREFLPVR